MTMKMIEKIVCIPTREKRGLETKHVKKRGGKEANNSPRKCKEYKNE
jgi:hypothetical protein